MMITTHGYYMTTKQKKISSASTSLMRACRGFHLSEYDMNLSILIVHSHGIASCILSV
jgi:hypothetical protein